MGTKELQVGSKKHKQIEFIAEKFSVGETIETLHVMMKEVTKKDINPATVNAACNCVQQLNNTLNSVINAARYLDEKAMDQ